MELRAKKIFSSFSLMISLYLVPISFLIGAFVAVTTMLSLSNYIACSLPFRPNEALNMLSPTHVHRILYVHTINYVALCRHEDTYEIMTTVVYQLKLFSC